MIDSIFGGIWYRPPCMNVANGAYLSVRPEEDGTSVSKGGGAFSDSTAGIWNSIPLALRDGSTSLLRMSGMNDSTQTKNVNRMRVCELGFAE